MSQNFSAANYTYPLGKTTLTASQVGTKIAVSLGGSFQQSVWIEISNESPYILSILSAQGILLNQLQPQLVDIAQIPSGDSFFIIVPTLLLPQSSPSSEVDINVYPFGKPEGAYPFPLGRQAAPSSAASQPSGYSASNLFNTANANNLALAVLNTGNASLLPRLELYAVRISIALKAAGNALITFGFDTPNRALSGASIIPVPNNTTNFLGFSNSTATINIYNQAAAIAAPGLIWEQIQPTLLANNPPFVYDFVAPIDGKELPINTSVIIIISGIAATGVIVVPTMKWIEQ